MRFQQLSEYFSKIEATTLRNEKMEILSELLSEVEGEEVSQVIYLALGRLRPKFDRLEFSMAERMIVRAVARVVDKSVEEVTQEYKRMGDLGEVFRRVSVSARQSVSGDLSVGEVYERLEKIAKMGGTGSQEHKVEGLRSLLADLDPESAGYVLRIILTKLRLGFSDKTVLDALSYMQYGSKEGRTILDSAYQAFPDVGRIAEVAKKSGVEKLPDLVGIQMGTPVMSALAQRVKTADEMVKKMGKVVCESKFDGQRVQIHYSRNKVPNTRHEQGSELREQGGLFAEEEEKKDWVRTFTRNLDENSAMFPELARVGDELSVNEVILDAEAVGYDPKTHEMLPFQMTIKRKRKHSIGEIAKEVPLKFYVFDIMYLDGKSLLTTPLIERRAILEKIIESDPENVLVLDDYLVSENPDEIREYHALQLSKGLEGAMIKKIDGGYLPGRQDYNWVKFKEAEGSEAKLSDTLDVVIMGYYKGKGKRAKFRLGALLVGVRDGEKILTIAKIGTGITDAKFVEFGKSLKKIESEEKNNEYEVTKIHIPDVWVEPEIVIEVAADEITKSPAHSSGMALRFPRLIRVRTDKDLDGVTTVEEVREISG